MILSDYGKGVLSRELAREVIACAKAAKRFVAVDPRGADWSRYCGADLVTPNRRELATAAGQALPDRDAIGAAARGLLDGHSFGGAVLVTLSEQGMLLVTAHETTHLPAMAREVADVTGAGDTVIATVAAAVAAGASMRRLP